MKMWLSLLHWFGNASFTFLFVSEKIHFLLLFAIPVNAPFVSTAFT